MRPYFLLIFTVISLRVLAQDFLGEDIVPKYINETLEIDINTVFFPKEITDSIISSVVVKNQNLGENFGGIRIDTIIDLKKNGTRIKIDSENYYYIKLHMEGALSLLVFFDRESSLNADYIASIWNYKSHEEIDWEILKKEEIKAVALNNPKLNNFKIYGMGSDIILEYREMKNIDKIIINTIYYYFK